MIDRKTVVQRCKTYCVLGTIALFCAINLHIGLRQGNPLLTAGGTIGLCYVMLRWAHASRAAQQAALAQLRRLRGIPVVPKKTAAKALAPAAAKPAKPEDLAAQMIVEGRCALLLRRQIAVTLNQDLFRRALDALRQTMAMVTEGGVMLEDNPSTADTVAAAAVEVDPSAADAADAASPYASTPGRMVRVERFFLDRFPVTNRLYQQFVAAGGYQQKAFWDKAAWPMLPSLVDQSALPGPRFWNNGHCAPGEEDHPVVGVSWYEAAACARWLGKRLPSDAEWVKASSWPVAISETACRQRRYPWGDVMEPRRANLWGTGPNAIVPVHEFAEGMSVGGVYQLIGNVWEWTNGTWAGGGAGAAPATAARKSIRGGAFDTFFDSQGDSQFQSSEDPLGRQHNIGFRCAVAAADLMLSAPADVKTPAAEPKSLAAAQA
jgi:iron(II)-dependent oxidoreductase